MSVPGFNGKVLRIDLSSKKIEEEELHEELVANYVGGTGICARYLYDELEPGIDPLGPENKLMFAVGPLTGTFWTSAGRSMVAAKAPLTGIWGEAHIGGFFGPELKYAGYDVLILEGEAEKPVDIIIRDDDITIEETELWGEDTDVTIDAHSERLDDPEVMCIGPAGENQVKYACIMNNYSNAAGRTGLGAVMGSKKVKSVVVQGTGSFEVADYQGFYEFTKEAHDHLMDHPQNQELAKYGTNLLVGYKSEIGEFVTKNHQTGVFEEGAEKLSAEVLKKKYVEKSRACFACRTHCKKVHRIPDGEYEGTVSGGPEYEGTMALGSNCMNANFGSILKSNELCNQLGLDVISAGCTIAFAMECSEKGLIDEDIEWGDHEKIVELVKKIAHREGVGEILAEGTREAAKRIGGDAEKYAMHVKGMEISGQDGRGHRSVALTHAISLRGADHLRSLVTVDQLGYEEEAADRFGEDALPEVCDPYSEEQKAKAVKLTEDVFAIRDSLITCWYTCGWPPVFWIEDFAEALPLVTGMDHLGDEEELMRIGERICNLRRLFNLREGLSGKDDTLPERFTEEPLPEGPSKDQTVDLERLLEDYYKLRNWDENGLLKREEAERLGLEEEWEEVLG